VQAGAPAAFVTAVFAAATHAFQTDGAAPELECPDEQHRMVVEFTDALTVGCEVPDKLFARARQHFDDRAITELSATIGAYNCVSRFLVALDVGERLGEEGMKKANEHVGHVKEGSKPVPREWKARED